MIAFRRRRFFIVLLAAGVGAGIRSGAKAQTCDSNVPHVTGQWMTLPYQMPINPISASLLRTGEVLIVAGSENDAHNNSEGSESYRAAVWDPTGTTQSSIAVQHLTYDVFCSGTAVLPDGRHLVVGGTSDYSFTGDNRASFFDPATEGFVQSQSMVDGRWYATATTLGDGRIMAFSGLKLSGGTNNTVEIYGIGSAGAGWSSPTSPSSFGPPKYPRMVLLPNGKVFYTGHGTSASNIYGYMFDPSARTWTSSVPTTRDRRYGSVVILPLLPPAYTPKVMALGGGGNPATSSTEIIDLSAASPAWTPGPDMSTGRIQMNAVILPDGTVLAMGGSVNNEAPNGPGKTADLYDPVTNTFRSAGTASYSRLYHSTALLLPDARVMSIGSNPGKRGRYEAAIEIYTPAYLFDSSDLLITTGRPSITAITPSSGVVGYNAPFSVNVSSASPIASAALVRPGSVTHSFDMEQRLIGLCGPSPQPACSVGGGTLSLTSPPNGNIAPPGYYMLFLLDSAGVPSKAQFIQLSAHNTSPPSGAIASPVSDVTIPAGGSVIFSTNTTAAKYSWIFPGGSPTISVAQAPGSVIFDVPGTYVASLTVIDADGNSDPSPPTRTITVTPPTPDFSITASPFAQVVTPGQATTFTVTVTPITGFAGPVTLTVDSESPFPSGVTSGGFSPASINGSGSSTLTMNTTTSAVPYALSLTVTGTSGALTHTTSTTLLVNLAPPASLTATPGNAQVSLSWAASIGANGYHVKRSLTSVGPYVGIACPTGTSYVDTGLTNGTTYRYVVSASYTGGPDAGGESADSSQASATPGSASPTATFTPIATATPTATLSAASTPTLTRTPTRTPTPTGVVPTVTSFSPTSGPVGTTSVVVTGSDFTGATAVTFNGASAVYTVDSPTQITATVPATATTGRIKVTTPAGTGTSATSFTVRPAITSFTPASGPVGTTVVITGTTLTGASSVTFNGVAASYTVNSSTQITATVPAGATTGKIKVNTGGGSSTSTANFTVNVMPVVSGLSPDAGGIASSVVITGTNFTGVTSVAFNGTNAAAYTVNSSTQITATVPVGATTGPVSVTTAGGTATSPSSFTVTGVVPTVTSFSPTSGPVGTTSVVVTGSDFTGATAVTFNGASAVYTVDSPTQITATVPATATTGRIKVTTPAGTGTSATSFTVRPAITSFTPASGPVGTTVVITGTTLTGASSVTFNGVAASYTVNSSTQITATVPAGATTGKIKVNTGGGSSTSTATFTVTP